MFSLRLAACAAAFAACATPAFATEAFLCEDGRIAYVEFGELENFKKTDPCVAAYFGLTLERPVAGPAAAATVAQPPRAAP